MINIFTRKPPLSPLLMRYGYIAHITEKNPFQDLQEHCNETKVIAES